MKVVAECLEAGCRAIQLRDKQAPAADLYRQALELLPLVRAHDALLFVNDRLDVALAAGADGVHLGPDDIPVEAVRARVSDTFRIGYSTDDPAVGRAAALASLTDWSIRAMTSASMASSSSALTSPLSATLALKFFRQQ